MSLAALGVGCDPSGILGGDDTSLPVFDGVPAGGSAGAAAVASAGGGAGTEARSWTECGRVPPFEDPTGSIALVGQGNVAVRLVSGRVLWAAGDGPTVALGGAQASFGNAVFSPDGALMVDVSAAPWRLRSTTTAETLRELAPAGTCGSTLQFAADSRHLLAFGNGDACVIDTASGAVLVQIPQSFLSLGWRDGVVVGATASGYVLTFDAQGTPGEKPGWAVTPEPFRWLVVSPNGERIATYNEANDASLFDAVSGAQLASYRVGQSRETAPPVFSGDGAYLALGDRVLQSETGEVTGSLAPPLGYLAASLSNDGKRLGILTSWHAVLGATAQVMDVASGRVLRAVGGHRAPVIDLAVAPDGEHVVTSGREHVIGWRVAEPFADTHPEWAKAAPTALRVRYSPDGALITVSGNDRELLSADGRELFRPLSQSPEPPQCAYMGFAISPDGRWLAGTSGVRQVDVFDLATHEPLVSLPTSGCNGNVTFSPDGEFLMTSVPELYSTRDWTRLWPTASAADAAFTDGVAFMPDAREALVSRCWLNEGDRGDHGLVLHCSHQVYTTGGRFVRTLPVLNGAWPSFSADGDIIAFGAQTLSRPFDRATPLDPAITSAAFAPNGDLIAGDASGALLRLCRN